MNYPSFFDSLRADIKPSFNDSLMHFGIKGMHWGIRRFQNPDGSLTPQGAKRYSNETAKNIPNYKPSPEIIKAKNDFVAKSNDLIERYDTDGYNNVIKGAREALKSEAFKKDCFNQIDEYRNKWPDIFSTKKDIYDAATEAAMDNMWKHIPDTPSGQKARAYQSELDGLFNDVEKYASKTKQPQTRKFILDSLNPWASYYARHDVFEIAIYAEEDVLNMIDKASDRLASDYINNRM